MSSPPERVVHSVATDPLTLTKHYEAARALVVGDTAASRPVIGLTVLYRWGLPAWMHVVQDAQSVAPPLGPRALPAVPESGSETAATILVIASMLLAAAMGSSPCTPRPN